MPALETILGDRLQITVLRWLANVRRPTSGNAIARQLGVPQSSARLALERLVEAGVVTRTDIGRSAGYALNEHMAVVRRVILPLFSREEELRATQFRDLALASRQLICAFDDASTPPATFVALFGSLARGDREYRDIDLLVVSTSRDHHEELRDRLADIATLVEQRFGVPLRSVIVSEADLMTASAQTLTSEVRADGVGLVGSPPAALAGIRIYTPAPSRDVA
jgi:predicted nucleotidyltransferase